MTLGKASRECFTTMAFIIYHFCLAHRSVNPAPVNHTIKISLISH